MKPSIFNPDMVRSILDDRKTNTRRPFSKYIKKVIKYACMLGEIGSEPFDDSDIKYLLDFAPYKKGDILYVRETFIRGIEHDKNDSPLTTEDRSDWVWKTYYRADNELLHWVDGDGDPINPPWKPSIHMKKEYARLFLRVKDVRIERLNEISEEDAIAEGVISLTEDDGTWYHDYINGIGFLFKSAKRSFQTLWESIYGRGSFNDDYVWVIEFEKISKEEAQNAS